MQISPAVKSRYKGCFFVVTGKDPERVYGYIKGDKIVPIDAKWQSVAWCGVSHWYEDLVHEFKHNFNGMET
jgi:hypothetical protein